MRPNYGHIQEYHSAQFLAIPRHDVAKFWGGAATLSVGANGRSHPQMEDRPIGQSGTPVDPRQSDRPQPPGGGTIIILETKIIIPLNSISLL